MITIIDYGLGNISAFVNVYKQVNIEISVAKNVDELSNATKLILPGVGSFDCAMSMFNDSGMRDAVDEMVLGKDVPVLGVCVGMQIMAKSSEEGKLAGLGWIEGCVRKLHTRDTATPLSLPHMGWNEVTPVLNKRIFAGIKESDIFYFLHSYYYDCPIEQYIAARSEYGISFASAINMNNIYGIQFHPEKSHSVGMQILKNFATI